MLGVSLFLLALSVLVKIFKDYDYVPHGLLIASASAFVLWLIGLMAPLGAADWLCVLVLCGFFVGILTQTALWAYIQHHGERLLTAKRRKAKMAIEHIEEIHPWFLLLLLAFGFVSVTEHIIGAFK